MIKSIYENEFGCKPDIISFKADCVKNGKIIHDFIRFQHFGLITNTEYDYNILNFFFNKYNGWNRVMWNKIFKTSLLKKIYFDEINFLHSRYTFFNREDHIHNTLIFMYADSFLDIERNIITYRLDEDRHQEILDNKKRIKYLFNHYNTYTKIFRNVKLIKNKSDKYKKILYERLFKYIKQEIAVGNYLINRYNLKDYIKNYIYNMKDNDIDPSIKFINNEKLIFEYKNIL
jgi:uncharacterized membrane protein